MCVCLWARVSFGAGSEGRVWLKRESCLYKQNNYHIKLLILRALFVCCGLVGGPLDELMD